MTVRVESAKVRARRGAKWLDETRPGWWRHIKITKLDMALGFPDAVGCGCIGAQLSGGYELFADEVLGSEDPARLGFDVSYLGEFGEFAPTKDVHREFALLDEAWKDEVRARRKKAAQ